METVDDLWHRLVATPIPRLAKALDGFDLWDSRVASYAHRLVDGLPLDEGALQLSPDDQTMELVLKLRSKVDVTDDEREFLSYYELLAEIQARVREKAADELDQQTSPRRS